MTKVSAQELEDWRERLSEWQEPERFVAAVEQLRRLLGITQYFTDPRVGFALDAWVGARLASITEASEVRLGVPPWPDYEERFSRSSKVEFEITEADIEGRRRGDEYKTVSEGWRFVSIEDLIAKAEQAPAALLRPPKQKQRKGIRDLRGSLST